MKFYRCNIKLEEINLSEREYTSEYFESMGEKKIKGIHIAQSLFAKKATTDLNFLQGIKNKAAVKAFVLDVELSDAAALEVLYRFENLTDLYIVCSITKTLSLHLERFKYLKNLRVYGNAELTGLDKIPLKTLMLVQNKKPIVISGGVEELLVYGSNKVEYGKDLPELKKLCLTKLNVASLSGMENLKNLEELAITYCPKLTDIHEISNCSMLRKLEFECVKKIESFTCLSKLKNLKGLILSNCGSVQSLEFINDMAQLKFLSFVDTNITDGDLTPCLRLAYAETTDKRHYNLKASELPKSKDCVFDCL